MDFALNFLSILMIPRAYGSERNSKEVGWKLSVIAMPCGLECWSLKRVQAMMGKIPEILVISGATMHERFIYRAICTMEL